MRAARVGKRDIVGFKRIIFGVCRVVRAAVQFVSNGIFDDFPLRGSGNVVRDIPFFGGQGGVLFAVCISRGAIAGAHEMRRDEIGIERNRLRIRAVFRVHGAIGVCGRYREARSVEIQFGAIIRRIFFCGNLNHIADGAVEIYFCIRGRRTQGTGKDGFRRRKVCNRYVIPITARRGISFIRYGMRAALPCDEIQEIRAVC